MWTRELGQGYSAFVADEGRVYTQYQSLGGQFVVCLEAQTGATIWQYRYGWPYEPAGLYPGPRSTPTLSDGRVYFSTPAGLVGCLDSSGGLIWSVKLYDRFRTPPPGFGYSCSPVVVDQLVLLPVGGKGSSLVALSAEDGATVWQSGDDAASYTAVLPITLSGKQFVIGYLENALVCCDLATGKQVWRKLLSDGYDEHAAWPIYIEPRLWYSGPFRSGSHMLQLSIDHAPVELLEGSSKLMSNDVSSSVYLEGFLYGFDLRDVQAKVHRPSRGEFRCMDFTTGKEQWSTDAIGHAAVIVADGKLCLFNDRGELILARASPERYEELGRATVLGGEIVWTPPVIYRDCVYLRNHSRAVCVFLGAEKPRDATSPPPLTIADIPQHPFRDVSVLLGVEPEYAMDLPSSTWLRDWYLLSLGILATAAGATALFGGMWRVIRRHWLSASTARGMFRAIAFLLGAVGTTGLSIARGDFTFTWPVCLFVLFVVLAAQATLSRNGKSSTPPRRMYSTLAIVSFLAGCTTFYYLCLRLSLATEWAFLTGFAAAAPVSVLRNWLNFNRPASVRSTLREGALTLLEFSLYYWASVGVMLWRCGGVSAAVN